MIQLRDITGADVDFVAEHSVSRSVFIDKPGQIEWSYAMYDGDKVLGIGGVILLTQTTAWVWIDVTDQAVPRDKVQVDFGWMNELDVLSGWLDELCNDLQLVRLQAYVEIDFPSAIRLVEYLGFERESVMRKFVGEKDAYMYRKIVR